MLKSKKAMLFYLNPVNLMNHLAYFDNYPNNYTGRSGIYSMGRNISFKVVIPIDVNTKAKEVPQKP